MSLNFLPAPARGVVSREEPCMPESIYERMGAKPAINARGIYTDLGGWRVSPRVAAAMDEANASYVEMAELLSASGARIARLLGVPAARVTPGASAAIVLGIAACMTGSDPARQ